MNNARSYRPPTLRERSFALPPSATRWAALFCRRIGSSAMSRGCPTYSTPRRLVSQLAFPAGDRVELPTDGIDERYRGLAPVVGRAFDGESYGEGVVTTGVIIVKGGKIVAERYRPGFGIHSGYRTWSTTKSISAA